MREDRYRIIQEEPEAPYARAYTLQRRVRVLLWSFWTDLSWHYTIADAMEHHKLLIADEVAKEAARGFKTRIIPIPEEHVDAI